LEQLESHLRESSNILRGLVDAAEFKTYIFPLLFFADVVELTNVRSFTYRVFDFIVEIIPHKQRLCLLLNLDFAVCEDPSSKALDASSRLRQAECSTNWNHKRMSA